MEDKDVVMIPFVVHEGDMARQERTIKRLWILCIMPVIDELMTTLQVLYPRLYNGVMNKL